LSVNLIKSAIIGRSMTSNTRAGPRAGQRVAWSLLEEFGDVVTRVQSQAKLDFQV
jgi:hypothetical protein